MQYAVLIYSDGSAWDELSEAEQQARLGEYAAIGQLPAVVGGAQLQPGETATTLRAENGTVMTSDGPFPETKEVLGGFFLLDADDLDAALEIASRVPAARDGGAVEVRPIVPR
jgi:hypothetical protein